MGPERNRTDDDQEGSGSGDGEEGEVVFRHIWLDSLMCFKLFDLFINVETSCNISLTTISAPHSRQTADKKVKTK